MTRLSGSQLLAGALALLVLAGVLRAQAYTFRAAWAWVSLLGLGAYRLNQKRLAQSPAVA